MDSIAERRSVRHYRPEAVPRELLKAVLEAAIQAPSASNKQPWRFVVVTQASLLQRMAEVSREGATCLAEGLAPRWRPLFERYQAQFAWFDQAPAVIVVLSRPFSLLSNMVEEGLQAEAREDVLALEDRAHVLSTGMAMQNLQLRAHELGLASCVLTGPLLAARGLREVLAVKPGCEILALITLGYALGPVASPGRKPLEQVCEWRTED